MSIPPIILPPSTDPDALVTAIKLAVDTGATLQLQLGTHFTRPGVNKSIAVGAKGLRIESVASPLPLAVSHKTGRLQRPDHAVDLGSPDDNYGLFFKPAAPTDDEIAALTWKPFTDPDNGDRYEFAVLMRGEIHLSRLLVDCNMQNQRIGAPPKPLAPSQVEHCAMLGFSGLQLKLGGMPERRVFVGFESITLQDMGFVNGGYADDVWVRYDRHGFHPHIARVTIARVESGERVDPKRDTISFSGLAQQIKIHDARVDSLHLEVTSNWRDDPRRDEEFANSAWDLADITAKQLSFAAVGSVVTLAAQQLSVTDKFTVSRAGGVIADSTLHVAAGEDRRFFCLANLRFDRVRWLLHANAGGVVQGLQPMCDQIPGNACVCAATFAENRFTAFNPPGNPVGHMTGFLINSAYSNKDRDKAEDKGNRVNLIFSGCEYDSAFGADPPHGRHIAHVNERGTWTFHEADLAGRSQSVALVVEDKPGITLNVT
jgi:hypothetical protein